MFDIGWQELFLVIVVTVVVVGPKDLPIVIRAVTGWIRKARGLAREFQNGLDEVVREAELDEVKKQVTEASTYDIGKDVRDTLDPTGEIEKDLDLTKVQRDLAAAADPIGAPAAEPEATGTATTPAAAPSTAPKTNG